MCSVHACKLTAAFLEDNRAAELVEPLGIKAWPVNGHGVLGGDAVIIIIVLLFLKKITKNMMNLIRVD